MNMMIRHRLKNGCIKCDETWETLNSSIDSYHDADNDYLLVTAASVLEIQSSSSSQRREVCRVTRTGRTSE